MGFSKLKKLFKSIQGWQKYKLKRVAVAFRRHRKYIRMATFASEM
jgi:hypothetical protein